MEVYAMSLLIKQIDNIYLFIYLFDKDITVLDKPDTLFFSVIKQLLIYNTRP